MGKESTSGYNYRGDFQALLAAVKKAVQQMDLKTSSAKIKSDSFSFEVAEKMRWMSTSWPVKLSIEATDEKGSSLLMVRARSASLPSITQDFSNQAKVQEFVELVKVFAPTSTPDEQAPSDIQRIPCPRCGEMIAKTAKICRFCRTEF